MACPLCGLEEATDRVIGSELKQFSCPRCGEFKLYEDTVEDIEDIFRSIKNQKHLISGYTRELKEAKQEPPLLTPDIFMFIVDQAPVTPLDKIDKTLMNLANMSSYPGKEIFIDTLQGYDYPLGYCVNDEEFDFYRRFLIESGLITIHGGEPIYSLTVKGWEKIENARKTSISSDQVFVAMNFDRKFDTCYDNGIKKALIETKYKPYRIDREEHMEKIDDKILSEIKRSKFIIAEFTGQKHGVYFEAGYAFGLGRPVIWTCHKDDVENLHFDTRQYNHIVWANESDLKEKLINRIRVLIGENQ
ncbi:MAG: nucleoside 2-deoxyribosyltransferase [Nitrospirae bacterium]|nr:nucleoside 2-deoxyribosyltransferase [Nitrospirota bacterium]